MKPELELKELELKVKELEYKVRDLELPQYKKLSFWTSIITVSVAVIGIIGQSILSSIKNEKAELYKEKATRDMEMAKRDMKIALSTKNQAEKFTLKAKLELLTIQHKKEKIKKDYDNITLAYSKIVSQFAYSTNLQTENNITGKRIKSIINETNNSISNILLTNSINELLKNSILKIYYIESTKEKAIEINNLLKLRGVKTEYTLPSYDISKSKENQIVYYNEPQLNYCKAVKSLLEKSDQGNFVIRLSSGANSTINHFKIYLVK